MKWYLFSSLCFFFVSSHTQIHTYPKQNPVELGKVSWLRDFDTAVSRSKINNLPIFILFQEVPGCGNCTQFGNTILSHPLVVETIETCFIPLCIYNNNSGKDAEILKKFNEPSWNNPVVRIIDYRCKDIVKRQSEYFQNHKIVKAMIEALEASNTTIPLYLEILHREWSAQLDEAYLSMFCFWKGEREISQIEGVVGTQAGYMHGKEVVKVTFDKSITDINSIAKKAKKVGCADEIYGSLAQGNIDKPIGHYRIDEEDKYYLSKSPLKAIPMTPLQKSLVNSSIANQKDPTIYLSPRQLQILNDPILSKKDHRNSEITKVWYQ
jgi:hypothetical protein